MNHQLHSTPTVYMIDPDRTHHPAVSHVSDAMNLQFESFISGHEFLDSFANNRLACIVSELKVPDVSGLDIQQYLAAQPPSPPVIFLTAHGTISIAVRAIRAGAIDFLEKPASEGLLWEAIREALSVCAVRHRTWMRHCELGQSLSKLTDKERQMLVLVGQGQSKRDIAKQMDACVRTIEMYQSRLRKKLKLETTAQLVHFAVVATETNSEGTLGGPYHDNLVSHVGRSPLRPPVAPPLDRDVPHPSFATAPPRDMAAGRQSNGAPSTPRSVRGNPGA